MVLRCSVQEDDCYYGMLVREDAYKCIVLVLQHLDTVQEEDC